VPIKVHKNGSYDYHWEFQHLREANTPVGRALAALEKAADANGLEVSVTVYRPISDRMQRFGHGYEWMYDSGFPHWNLCVESAKDGSKLYEFKRDGEFRVHAGLTERSALGQAIRAAWSTLDNHLLAVPNAR